MAEFIKTCCAIIVCFFVVFTMFLTVVIMFGNWDTANMNRVLGSYAVSGFMILCNGVVYVILEAVDTINKRLT